LVVLLAATAAAAPSPSHAQTDVTTTLMKGGEPLIFSGKVNYNKADRYFFVARKDARLVARITGTSQHLVLAVVPADADPTERQAGHRYAKELDLRLPADGRHAVAVLFNPHLRFYAPPPPASYRLEIRME
jgi:hypothetical protein